MLYNLAVFRLFTVRSFHELRKRLISLETGLAPFLLSFTISTPLWNTGLFILYLIYYRLT